MCDERMREASQYERRTDCANICWQPLVRRLRRIKIELLGQFGWPFFIEADIIKERKMARANPAGLALPKNFF